MSKQITRLPTDTSDATTPRDPLQTSEVLDLPPSRNHDDDGQQLVSRS
jgi:hypothetical protein